MDPPSPPRDLELSALEAEKEPMAAEPEGGSRTPPQPHRDPVPPPQLRGGGGGGEKNGLVVKIPPENDEEEEEEEAEEEAAAAALGGPGVPGAGGTPSGTPKFTGLGKEELLREAGSPPWARARRALLVLFWGGWLGMLGAAAAIVAQAPRCQPLPHRAWWELGAIYRAPPKAFGGDLKGVAEHLEHLEELQVGGLVLGPVYPLKQQDPQNPGKPPFPELGDLDPELGDLEDFGRLLKAAKKKGVQVIVDLTPNPGGDPVWGEWATDPVVQQRVKDALTLWLERGASGIFLDGIDELELSVVTKWRNLTENSGPGGPSRVLVGGTRLRDPQEVLNRTGGLGLLVGPFLKVVETNVPGDSMARELRELLGPKTGLGWTMGTPWEAWGNPPMTPQLLLLVWGLPGTPVLSYGDEVGLQRPPGSKPPPMPWERIQNLQVGGNSTEGQVLELCRALAGLRARERSLLLGEAEVLGAGGAVAVLRRWDQNERFLLLLNPQGQPLPQGSLSHPSLPSRATLRLSTHPDPARGSEVELGKLRLQPFQGVLLSFPYKG